MDTGQRRSLRPRNISTTLATEDSTKNKNNKSIKKSDENILKSKPSRKRKLQETLTNGSTTDMSTTLTASEAAKDEFIDAKEKLKNSLTASSSGKVYELDITYPKYESLGVGPKSRDSKQLSLTGKMFMGSHVSGAGGVWKAFKNAQSCQSKSFALFLRSQRQWNAKPLEDETVNKWKEAAEGFAMHLVLPHGSYLMNLGSPKDETLEKSRNLLVEELQRCERLGIPYYNFHPGSSLGDISREECCELIAQSINLAHQKTKSTTCVIENMCRQGNTVGGDFREIRRIITHVEDKSRVGVCIDTCHAHAAGYDLASEEGFNSLLEDFEKIIGWQFLCGLHINDSKGKCGDRKDRHENIGKGTIGIEGFRRVMNCSHFTDLPLILETPYTDDETYAKEVRILEKLISR